MLYSLGLGPSGQSRFVCQVCCTGIQGIYSQFPGGIHWPKFVHLVLVFKASLLYYPRGPLAKVCSSAKFGVLVPSAKVGSSAKFGVVVFKASIL